ncbi:putative uncharacterized protein [Bacteroides sp. CAG:633]|uniref:DUF418 domain-containing protein n=1 Tax=Bacteroides sp. CAG:633 TaxID=1262744 RepID=UPI00033D9689|nr:DUF418 domain-containing protein [Bacteroides sp. CAG:633]CDB11117.1 putative uncharacterized protein [Bacteroides sp. CAG:633]
MEQPTGKHARVEVADVLRGLAVMGIILLHSIEHFNFYSFPDTTGQSAWLTFTDKAVWDGLFFLLGGKAYAVFALLFGFSYFIQYDNQRMRGHDFRLRFCWRLILLFLIGNLNAMFFTAEVLVLYSLVGFILPLTCKMKDKWIFVLACILLIQPLPLYYTLRACFDPAFVTPALPTGDLWGATFEVQSHGTFWETVRVNLWEGQLASLAWAWDNGRVFQTAALFLLGFLAGKRGLFLKENLKIWNKVLCGSLLAFFPLYGLGNMLPGFIDNPSIRTPLLLIISSLYKFAFMLLLVSAILFAYYRTRLQRRLAQIVPYGRMSLTNYITQSIFGSLLFYNWGFGLHDDLGITASFLTGILLFILQFSFCRWWMAHHSHGPMEYLWKRATWLK